MKSLEHNPSACHTLFGPPFPTGEPHYGHVTNFILKDIILGINRFLDNTVSGSEMRFDVHGLPTELKVQELIKERHGLTDIKEIVDKLGLKTYNDMCKTYIRDVMQLWPAAFVNLCPSIGYSGVNSRL